MAKATLVGENVLDAVTGWVLLIVGCTFVVSIGKGVSVMFTGRVTQNMIAGVRQQVYEATMRQDIGWHDNRNNSAGVITATLASDVQLLSGIGVQSMVLSAEGGLAILTGVVFAGIFSWPFLIIGFVSIPLVLISGAIAAKAD
jgi:ATP-binding cassette subfamily B (MDR/TAP) protein 1